jgi:hypothetical protein
VRRPPQQRPALGSARNHADHGPPFDAASEQQTGQHYGTSHMDRARSSAANRGIRPAHACHRSSHRVESLAVSLRQRAKTSPLGADKQLRHILHGKELSNLNESDLLCYWPQEGPSSFVSRCHYPESNADFGINWLFPVAMQI